MSSRNTPREIVPKPQAGDNIQDVLSRNDNDIVERELSFICESCNRGFYTRSGLGVHVRRTHPVEANSVVNVERVKTRWPVEEIRLIEHKLGYLNACREC